MHTYHSGSLQPYINNKTVVITGASSGVGRAMAIEFARHGARIVLAGRNVRALEEVEMECKKMGASALTAITDVTDAEQVSKLAALAAEFGDGIDVWINNAGVLAAGSFTDTPMEVHEQVIGTNLIGYLHGAYAVLPYFKDQQRGILINNISVGGWFPIPYGAAYSASKFGLRGFSAALRGELSDYKNIRICDLYPAFLDTPGMQHAANYTGKTVKPAPPLCDPQDIAREVIKLVLRPHNTVMPGATAPLLKLSYLLFPELTTRVTGRMMKGYLRRAPASEKTSGNLFETVPFGTSIHGGWNSAADMEERKRTIIKTAVAAGFAAGLMFMVGRRLKG